MDAQKQANKNLDLLYQHKNTIPLEDLHILFTDSTKRDHLIELTLRKHGLTDGSSICYRCNGILTKLQRGRVRCNNCDEHEELVLNKPGKYEPLVHASKKLNYIFRKC